MLGAEESGGLSILGHIPDKDGILACLLVAEMAAVTGKSLTELYEDFSAEYGKVVNEKMDCIMPSGSGAGHAPLE